MWLVNTFCKLFKVFLKSSFTQTGCICTPKFCVCIHFRQALSLMTAFGTFLILYQSEEMFCTFCTSWVDYDRFCLEWHHSTEDYNSSDRCHVWSRGTDSSVTKTRINWIRWNSRLNFKPLSCASKAASSYPVLKVNTDIVFSLCLKDVQIGCSLWRIVLDCKVWSCV